MNTPTDFKTNNGSGPQVIIVHKNRISMRINYKIILKMYFESITSSLKKLK